MQLTAAPGTRTRVPDGQVAGVGDAHGSPGRREQGLLRTPFPTVAAGIGDEEASPDMAVFAASAHGVDKLATEAVGGVRGNAKSQSEPCSWDM